MSTRNPRTDFPPKPKGWRSGFCPINGQPWQHERCAGVNPNGVPCVCDCHKVPAGRPVTEQATEILAPAEYLSPEWYEARRASVSASEIAAILGLSPWQSPFDLWWQKRTGSTSEAENKAQRRGRRYEALILEDFADEHPELSVLPVGLVRNNDRPWQTCTPDGLAVEYCHEDHAHEVLACSRILDEDEQLAPLAVIEAKTAGSRDGWGPTGTDDIPVYYRTQVLWQMDTLGLNVAYVPVRFGFDYAEYVVEYDEADVKLMREAAEEFLASVREDRMPEPDSHKATTRRLKRLHPDLVDGEAEVPVAVLRQYQRAKRLRDAAQDRMRLAENRIRHALGSNARGTVDGRKVLTRSIYEVAEHVRKASTTDRINFPRKEI